MGQQLSLFNPTYAELVGGYSKNSIIQNKVKHVVDILGASTIKQYCEDARIKFESRQGNKLFDIPMINKIEK